MLTALAAHVEYIELVKGGILTNGAFAEFFNPERILQLQLQRKD